MTQDPAQPVPQVLPYGSWPSPITAADAAAGGRRLSFPRLVPTASAADELEVWWGEGRPEEGGRDAVARRSADGRVFDVLPPPWNARSRVHEYGGAAWLAAPLAGGGGEASLVFVHFHDQRVYRLDPSGQVRPLTPEPPAPLAWRYVDPQLVGDEVWWVRERHDDARVVRDLVAVPLDGSAAEDPAAVRTVIEPRSDFLSSARVSPGGRRVAWIAWDHPRMPWEGAELRVAPLEDGAAGAHRTLLGGPAEAALQPEWADDATLYGLSDRTGWWNLYRLRADGSATAGEPEPLCPQEEEFGTPLWTPGYRTYGVLADGRLAVLHGVGPQRLAVLDPRMGELSDVGEPDWSGWSWAPTLEVVESSVACLVLAPDRSDSIVRVNLDLTAIGTPRARASVVRGAAEELPERAYLPAAQVRTLTGGPANGGREVHVVVYPPRNPRAVGPAGELPPYLVHVHGGPTAHSLPRLNLDFAYFTSRGVGVVDVNYGGSTGYGRAYRERLRGEWGVVDVEDCVAAGLALADLGEADRARLAIRGGSAGGWTTLAALTRTDVFAAGVSYYGVAELLRFAEDTHDFESRYLDGLIGPLPEARDVYVERAPVTHAHEVSCPVLLLQGLEDKVVPPSQSELFRDALVAKGLPHAYLTFEGEGHGFRRADSNVRALEAELSFYGQVLGFDTPGVPALSLSGP